MRLRNESEGQLTPYVGTSLDVILIDEYEAGPLYEELRKHKLAVEAQLAKYGSTPTIFAKYAWVAGYHNYFCDLHQGYFGDDYKIQTDLFRAFPRLIIE